MSQANNKFLVLLASYKGHDYLVDQVQSILEQADVDVRLQINDDEDSVKTQNFLQSSHVSTTQIRVSEGPHAGVNANFLSLVQQAVGGVDFYAFSDQDDVWHSDKLLAAQKKLNQLKTSSSVLYMGRTTVCDEVLTPIFLSKDCPRPPDFKNALLESIAGGNTMVFNPYTLTLLQKINHPVHHDWLAYMVVTACGGEVVFDDDPYVLYRQHANNVIGANRGLAAKWQRFTRIMSDEFRGWATHNIQALAPLLSDMTPDNKATYLGFKKLHELQGWHLCFHRVWLFHRLGLYRQRRIEHWGFVLAAFLGKI